LKIKFIKITDTEFSEDIEKVLKVTRYYLKRVVDTEGRRKSRYIFLCPELPDVAINEMVIPCMSL
jgi:hypothetical protein